jgi:hypothetical protein
MSEDTLLVYTACHCSFSCYSTMICSNVFSFCRSEYSLCIFLFIKKLILKLLHIVRLCTSVIAM